MSRTRRAELLARFAAQDAAKVAPPTAPAWHLRAVWPIDDLSLSYAQAEEAGTTDLYDVASRHGALIVADPWFEIRETDPGRDWPNTPTVLIGYADAVPASPSQEQRAAVAAFLHGRWRPAIIRHFVAQGVVDRVTADILGITDRAVRRLRERNNIPPAVPRGYTAGQGADLREREARAEALVAAA